MYGIKKACKSRKNYADGGVITGPGTGTSDDIQKTIPKGAYIMPADSTKAMGAENIAKLGAPTPVNVSNGEYELPPEQVHAVGVEALNQMKDATHTPTGFGVRNMSQDKLFFADGGSPMEEDEKRRRPVQVVAGAAQTQAENPDKSPYEGVTDNLKNGDFSSAKGFGATVRASANQMLDIGQDIGRHFAQPYKAVGRGVRDFVQGFSSGDPEPANNPQTPITQAAAKSPSTTVSQPMLDPSKGSGTIASDSRTVWNSGGIRNPGAGGNAVNYTDMRSANAEQAKANDIRQQTIDSQPRGARKLIGDSATQKRNERVDLKLAIEDARRAGDTRAMVKLNEQLQQSGQFDKANEAALQRLGIKERNRSQIANRKLDQEEKALGFGIRNQARLEKLYQEYEEAAPEDKAAIAEQIRVLSGKDEGDKYTVVPGGERVVTDKFGNTVTVNEPSYALNNRTGKPVPREGGQQSGLVPAAQNPEAIAIAKDTSLSREERAAKLRQLGYQ